MFDAKVAPVLPFDGIFHWERKGQSNDETVSTSRPRETHGWRFTARIHVVQRCYCDQYLLLDFAAGAYTHYFYCSDVLVAFNEVSRGRLCCKLRASGLRHELISFLHSWWNIDVLLLGAIRGVGATSRFLLCS